MPLVVPNWLGDHVALPDGVDINSIAAALVKVGIEEEAVHPAAVTGPLVVGRVLAKTPEPQSNGKTINWCLVDVGPQHNTNTIKGVTAEQLAAAGAPESGARGIVCGAHNFEVGDYVVVSLPGTVLPGPFPIAARKTYGHISDGMICSTAELAMGDDGSHGIIVLTKPFATHPGFVATELTPGQNAIELLGLGDETLEVNVTPDRGYQFSYRGIAREYGLATGAKFTDPVVALAATVPAPTSAAFPVQIDDAAPIRGNVGCDRFATRIVRGINANAPTPAWMKKRLEQSGMRSISLAVDVTNYVMLDLGQPIHAYDLDKVQAPIVVRRAHDDEKLTTLDGVERALHPEDLLITDSPNSSVGASETTETAPSVEVPALESARLETTGTQGSRVLGLAGVMGGESTEISDTTQNVLVEAAHFDPVSVARTARRHKLPSEAAKRFERGVDPVLPPVAAQMVVDLLVKYAGGTADPAVGDLDATASGIPITLPLDLPSRIVGVPYSPATIIQVLESVGCQVEPTSPPVEVALNVTPPSWRPDLTEPVDLVEEIVRIDGYGKVPSVLPAAPGGRGLTPSQRLRRSVARTLAEAGLVEVLNYPFVGPKDYEAMRLLSAPEAQSSGNPGTRLANPLSADKPDLRSNLLITLLDAAKRNYQRGLTDFGLFEIGLVTQSDVAAATSSPAPSPSIEEAGGRLETTGNAHLVPPVGAQPDAATLTAIHSSLPDQPRQVAGVLVGETEASGWWGTGRKAEWSDALGLAGRVADRAGVAITVKPNESAGPSWHPGRSAVLVAEAQPEVVIGVAGELHPKVATNFGLPARPVAFELNLTALDQVRDGGTVKATPVSAYPVAKEDFAFVVPAETPASEVESAIVTGAGELLESAALFDVFTGQQLGDGLKSLAYTVRLRAADRTLTVDDVKATREAIIAAAQKLGRICVPNENPKQFTVAVAGASGYAGGEFLRLAAKHPNLKIGALTAHSNAGEKLGALHPHLRSLADRVLEPTTPEVLAGHDVVVFAVPHGASGELARQVQDHNAADSIFIDLGADHRLIDPAAWQQFYGSEHAGTWTYGMPELINGDTERAATPTVNPWQGPGGPLLRATGFAPALKQRDLLRNTKEIAGPGCNVTAVTLGLQPGFADGVLDPHDVVAVLQVGYSGAGKAAKTHLLASEGLGSAAPYAVGGTHRHIPEIQQNLSISGGGYIAPHNEHATAANDFHVSFTPVLVPMSRGILAVCSAKLSATWQIILDTDQTPDKTRFKQWLREVWEDAYRGEPFIQVLPAGDWPKTGDVSGSNNVQIQVDYDLGASRVIVIAALDNLVKGTAGAAIQSLNLALGLPETNALDIDGVAP